MQDITDKMIRALDLDLDQPDHLPSLIGVLMSGIEIPSAESVVKVSVADQRISRKVFIYIKVWGIALLILSHFS